MGAVMTSCPNETTEESEDAVRPCRRIADVNGQTKEHAHHE
jgi:hypothetical protein